MKITPDFGGKSIPSIKLIRNLSFMIFSRTPKPISFAKIRTQILSRWVLKKDNSCSVIAFTSRLPGEGVSTVTTGLARSFSATDAGKILLLNAGRKHPRRARTLDVTELQEYSNLSDYVTKDRKFGFDTIRLANISKHKYRKVSVPPKDLSPENDEHPVPEIQSEDDGTLLEWSSDIDPGTNQKSSLLRKIRETYNIILIDAGSLNNPNGTFWLLNSEHNILVIDSSRTTRESLEYQKLEFENSDMSIDGSILNKRKFPIPRSLYWLVR